MINFFHPVGGGRFFRSFAEVEEESGIKLVTKTGGVFFTDEADGHAADVEDYASALSQQNEP